MDAETEPLKLETERKSVPLMAITVRQPWAWLMVRPDVPDVKRRAVLYEKDLIKYIENRTWTTKHRGRIYIHAGKQWECDNDEVYARRLIMNEYALELPSVEMPLGAIVGYADLVDCVEEHHSQWFVGPFGFVLANIMPLPKPIKCQGKQGIFKLDAATVKRLEG
ncbi:MAG: ASCH domain-containing protein [Pseudomonadota bacterium]